MARWPEQRRAIFERSQSLRGRVAGKQMGELSWLTTYQVYTCARTSYNERTANLTELFQKLKRLASDTLSKVDTRCNRSSQ